MLSNMILIKKIMYISKQIKLCSNEINIVRNIIIYICSQLKNLR